MADSRRDALDIAAVADQLARWSTYLRRDATTPDPSLTPKEEKAANRFLSEQRFSRRRKQCRLRELPLAAIFPDVERLAIPLGAINEETGHPNHAEMQYVIATARHRGACRIFEFGTFMGRTTYHLAAANPAAQVWTLDLPRDENPWPFAEHVGTYFSGAPEAARITVLRQNSVTFDPSPYARSMDFVWVDGDHSYEGVENDTEKALAMLAPGGAVMWHDFGFESPGLVDYFVDFTSRLPLFQIRRTSVLLHIDGIDPLGFEAHPVQFSKSVFKR